VRAAVVLRAGVVGAADVKVGLAVVKFVAVIAVEVDTTFVEIAAVCDIPMGVSGKFYTGFYGGVGFCPRIECPRLC
jgi:hypothetical protein